MSVSRPCSIKVKTGVYVNVTNTMSFAIEAGLAQEVPELKEGGDPNNKEDYEIKMVTADTVSFYFPNDRGLAFRVGFEIQREDYERMKRILTSLEYKERKPVDDGKSSTEETDKGFK